MGWKYFGDRTWAEVTRDERFFCQHLYGLIQQDVPGFVRKLNELAVLNLPHTTDWEIGFEVCFYRDFRFMCTKDGLDWHNESLYSPKRTFDLCLFSHHHIVIIEAKAQQGFDLPQMAEFKKDRQWVKEVIASVTDNDGSKIDVEVLVVALASQKYLDHLKWEILNNDATFSGQPISWAALAKYYDNNQKTGDPVLLRADAIYEENRSGGKNNDGRHKTGNELLELGQQGISLFVGRNGGLNGKFMNEDIKTGNWKTQPYETSLAETKPNQNWFSLQEFITAVSAENSI